MSISAVTTRLSFSLGTIAVSLSLLLTGCSDTSMSGNTGAASSPAASATPATSSAGAAASPTGPALGTSADATTTSLDAVNSGSGSGSDEAANGSGSGSNNAATGGAMTITKSIGGIPLEDKTATITVTRINADGSSGPTATVSYNAGAQGAQQLANLCASSGPTNVTMKVNVAGSANTSTTGAGTSTASFDPTTCAVSNLLSGGKGDSFALSCEDGPVVIK